MSVFHSYADSKALSVLSIVVIPVQLHQHSAALCTLSSLFWLILSQLLTLDSCSLSPHLQLWASLLVLLVVLYHRLLSAVYSHAHRIILFSSYASVIPSPGHYSNDTTWKWSNVCVASQALALSILFTKTWNMVFSHPPSIYQIHLLQDTFIPPFSPIEELFSQYSFIL